MICSDALENSYDGPPGFARNTGFLQAQMPDLCGQDIEPRKPADPYRAVRQLDRFLLGVNPSREEVRVDTGEVRPATVE